MKTALLALGIALLAGCANSGGFKVVKGGPDPTVDATPALTMPIGLVADTQFHESRGVPSRYLGLGGDEFVDVTIRTGQQVIGAGDVLAAALKATATLPLVIHAGDAIDVSCETEWTRFKQTMTSSHRGEPGPATWLFTPGNHDGYLTGNIYPASSGLYWDGYWVNLCNAGQLMKSKTETKYSFMAKHKLVQDYVAMLGGSFGSDAKAEGCDTTGRLCWRAFAPMREPWRSFVVQAVRLPPATEQSAPVFAVLLDSSDYDDRPYLDSFVAGKHGDLSQEQFDAVGDLLRRVPAEGKFFFIAHHPSSAWRVRSWGETRLMTWKRLMSDSRSLRFVVTAHTHEGSLRENTSLLGRFVELNTGSLADAPLYVRNLEFRRTSDGRIGFRSEAMQIGVDVARCKSILPIPADLRLDYGVETQRSLTERAGEKKPGLAALGNAIWYFFNLWESKHKELRPHLLGYADIVDATMPADATLSYVWTSTEAGTLSQSLRGGTETSRELREHANCRDGFRKCSAQSKANLLFAVEQYYNADTTPAAIKEQAREMRLCMAVMATNDSSAHNGRVKSVSESLAVPWAQWLPTGAAE